MPEIDKAQHYGRYQKQEDRRHKLAMKVAHMALDIPEDDMEIRVNKRGLGAKGVIGIVLAAVLPPSLLAAWALLRQPEKAETPVPQAPQVQKIENTTTKGFLIDLIP